jgi:L-fuculose-phosphate aldolase
MSTTDDVDESIRHDLVRAARKLVESGLTRGTSGNISARMPDRTDFWVTASGCGLGEAAREDLVKVAFDGAVEDGSRAPSSEWRIHRDVYCARPEVQAIVHVHPPFATTVACMRRALPPVHYEIAFAGGHDVRCAAYATFGTEELSLAALSALTGRNACLLANHGMIALGASLEAAMHLAGVIETVAEIYWRTLAVGEPVLIERDEMERVVAKLASYGPNAPKC